MLGQLTLTPLSILREQYQTAKPFPHLVIDDVFPKDELMRAYSDWPSSESERWGKIEKGRFTSLKRGAFNCASAPKSISKILKKLHTSEFVDLLSGITGIESLIADPKFAGAGLHETFRTGFLHKHVDFNRMRSKALGPQPEDPYRRLNVFLYMNPDWRDEWNGHLYLWKNKGDEKPTAKIAPIFNRLVICEASERSWHGHPEPLACPEDRSRRSMAWYFYTHKKPDCYQERHSTIWVKNRKRK